MVFQISESVSQFLQRDNVDVDDEDEEGETKAIRIVKNSKKG